MNIDKLKNIILSSHVNVLLWLLLIGSKQRVSHSSLVEVFGYPSGNVFCPFYFPYRIPQKSRLKNLRKL